MRYDAIEVKESLSSNDVIKILKELGAENVTYKEKRDEIVANTICHNLSHGSQKLYYKPTTYSFHCFTECSCSFDIYELVRKVYRLRDIELTFRNAVEFIVSRAEKKSFQKTEFFLEKQVKKNEDLEWLKRFQTKDQIKLSEPDFYDDSILEVFSGHREHPLFVNDGILPEVMDFYNIRYYDKDERIVIPHRYYKNGKIISLRGRATREWDVENGVKYLPLTIQGHLYSALTYTNLFGLWQNKSVIQRFKKVAIFESEKSVMQMASMYGNEYNYSVALSGKNLSEDQIEMLLELNINEVVLCFDKEYEEHTSDEAQLFAEKIAETAKKFNNLVQVSTIWDTAGLIGHKESPTDRGKEVFELLMREKIEI